MVKLNLNVILYKYFKLNHFQQKLIFCFLCDSYFYDYNIDKMQIDDSKVFKISFDDIYKLLNINGQIICNKSIKKEFINLVKSYIELVNLKNKSFVLSWFSSVIFEDDFIKININNYLLLHLIALNKYLSQLNPVYILSFKNKYSAVFYFQLKQIKKCSKKYSFDELIDLFSVENTNYVKDWRNFKHRILETVRQDLKENADIFFTYKVIKNGQGNAIQKIIIKIKKRVIKNKKILIIPILK